jgi:glycosyltransferase involved in cell wall biosynthesis
MSSIWLTWEVQRRNRSLADAVGATLHELLYSGNAIARYCVLTLRTLRVIRRAKPRVIYYQNPSLVLSALLATLKFLRVTRAKLVGDFHNAGVHPPAAGFLVPWIVRNSDLVVVSNKNLEPAIQALGGRCLSMPDPIPTLHGSPATAAPTAARFAVFFICSWAPDEPIFEVLRAAQIIASREPAVVMSITGRPKLEKIGWTEPVPANVRLTGFLAETEFEQRLLDASVVLDLTTRADCMVCGAYEAVSAEVPMVLSDNEPTRSYFRKGALFTDNTAESIAEELLRALANHTRLRADVIALKRELLDEERASLRRLIEAIN